MAEQVERFTLLVPLSGGYHKKMRSFLCLVALTGVGCALLLAPASVFRLEPPLASSEWLGWWLASLKTFAVPLVLVLLRFFNKSFARAMGLFWGLWLTLSTVLVVSNLGALCPTATVYGEFLASLTVILSIALVLFSAIELNLAGRVVTKRNAAASGNQTAEKP